MITQSQLKSRLTFPYPNLNPNDWNNIQADVPGWKCGERKEQDVVVVFFNPKRTPFLPHILSLHAALSVFLTTDHSLNSLHFVRCVS